MRPHEILSHTAEELEARARALLERGHGRARQVHAAALCGEFSPRALGLSAAAAAGWRERFCLTLPEPVRLVGEPAATGVTAKASLRLWDGLECEMVRLPMGRQRTTLCLSSQVGCKLGCGFCETGRMGLLRQMSCAEIVGQLVVARSRLGWPVRNVVFMGMGEPLDNYDNVLAAIRVLTDPGGLAMAQERLTLCTVGHVAGIRRLAGEGLRRLNLSVSLNAARDALRAELMPVARTSSLGELQDALCSYRPRPNFTLGVNYCLLPGLNDTRDDARAIAEFCAPLGRVMLNLIAYNPGGAPVTRAPDEAEVLRFVGWLREEGLPVRRRVTKGRKVMAACGQLGNLSLRKRGTPGAASAGL